MESTGSRWRRRARSWSRRTFIAIGIVMIVLLLIRLVLPWALERGINGRLSRIPGYQGHVEHIAVSLFRGAYSLHNVRVLKSNGGVPEPFFSAQEIDFSVAWRQLFHRQIVSDIHIDNAEVNIVKGTSAETSQTEVDRRWQDVVKDIFPIDITYLEIQHSVLNYIDRSRDPDFHVYIKNMHLEATGLRNRPEKNGQDLPATVIVDGDSLGGGKLHVFVEAEPLADQPHFHFTMSLQPVSLPALNDFLKAYGNVDVSSGVFRMFVEVAARGGRFEGYIKPFFEKLEFKSQDDKKKGLASRLWEKLVAGLVHLLKNKSRDQLGTRIPFAGEIGDPKAGIWPTVRNVFHHGFVRAFTEDVDNSVKPQDVEPARAPEQEAKEDRKAIQQNATESASSKTKSADEKEQKK
jgi:hypothetical protein